MTTPKERPVLCECGHPKSHHFHRPPKPPSRITMKEDAYGHDKALRDAGKCITFLDAACVCTRFRMAA